MPYTAKDAPDYIAAGKKEQWAAIWNSVYSAAIKDGKTEKEAESSAFAQATGVVNKKSIDTERGVTVKQEIRTLKGEMRAESQGDEMALVGYAALFNTESKDLGGFRETIRPGAFKRSLDKGDDVKALFNHSPMNILGRTKNKTLTLKEDARGLQFRVQLDPNNSQHRDLHSLIKNGTVDECSFAFTVNGSDGEEWKAPEKNDNQDWFSMRTLKDVNLMDVSAVCMPAYEGTTVMARGEEVIPAEIRSAIAAKQAEKRDDDSYEQEMKEVSKALDKAYPAPTEGSAPCCGSCSKYWVIETHDDYVIACEWGTGLNWKIPYTEDEATETFTFGTPEQVESKWVPEGERGARRIAEYRAAKLNTEQRSEDDGEDEADADWDMEGEEMPGDSDAVKAAKGAYKTAKGAAKDAYKKAKDEAGAMKDDGKDKAKAHKAAAKDTYKKAKDGAKAALKAVKDGEAQRSMAAIIEQHKKAASDAALAAAAASKTKEEHDMAAASVQAAVDAKKQRCDMRKKKMEDEGYGEDDYDETYDPEDPNDTDDMYEENCMVTRDKVWTGDTPKDEAERISWMDAREAYLGTLEFRDSQVRTKKVGGANLTKDKFAFVGDANDTSTWKFPVHDASHARNALARWGQHTGIPAESEAGVYGKIKSAAKKFGIEVTETDADKAARTAQEVAEYRDDRLRRLKAAVLS